MNVTTRKEIIPVSPEIKAKYSERNKLPVDNVQTNRSLGVWGTDTFKLSEEAKQTRILQDKIKELRKKEGLPEPEAKTQPPREFVPVRPNLAHTHELGLSPVADPTKDVFTCMRELPKNEMVTFDMTFHEDPTRKDQDNKPYIVVKTGDNFLTVSSNNSIEKKENTPKRNMLVDDFKVLTHLLKKSDTAFTILPEGNAGRLVVDTSEGTFAVKLKSIHQAALFLDKFHFLKKHQEIRFIKKPEEEKSKSLQPLIQKPLVIEQNTVAQKPDSKIEKQEEKKTTIIDKFEKLLQDSIVNMALMKKGVINNAPLATRLREKGMQGALNVLRVMRGLFLHTGTTIGKNAQTSFYRAEYEKALTKSKLSQNEKNDLWYFLVENIKGLHANAQSQQVESVQPKTEAWKFDKKDEKVLIKRIEALKAQEIQDAQISTIEKTDNEKVKVGANVPTQTRDYDKIMKGLPSEKTGFFSNLKEKVAGFFRRK